MNPPVKVLVIRFSSIGDIVLTTPIVRALKQQLEGEVILHFLTKKQFAFIMEANPYIDQVFSIEKSTNEVKAPLKEEGYDYIIDLHKNLRSSSVRRALKSFAFDFDKLNWEKWVTVNFKKNILPDKHIVDRYFEGIAALGIENDGKGLDYFIPEGAQFPLQDLPETHQKAYVALAVGAQHATKRMPLEVLEELCRLIQQPIIVLGGKEDEEVGEQLAERIGDRLISLCGKSTLHQSASLVRNAKVVITHDTGMMHIAAAFEKDIISIWGNTIPEFGMYPYLAKGKQSSIYQVDKLSCRPCSKIGFDKCPKKHFNCMKQQDVQAIAAEANQLFE